MKKTYGRKPQLDFYAKLYTFLNLRKYREDVAGMLIEIYEQNRSKISFRTVNLRSLRRWHAYFQSEKRILFERSKIDRMIGATAFRDLASQMHDGAARLLLKRYKRWTYPGPEGLCASVQKIKPLYKNCVIMTIVIDNLPRFKSLFKEIQGVPPILSPFDVVFLEKK